MTASIGQITESYSRLKQEVTDGGNEDARIAVADMLRMSARGDARSVVWAKLTAKKVTAFQAFLNNPQAVQKLADTATNLVRDADPYADLDPQAVSRQAVSKALPDDVITAIASDTWNPRAPHESIQVLSDHIMTQAGYPPSELMPTVPYMATVEGKPGPYSRADLGSAWNIYQTNISHTRRNAYGQESLSSISYTPWAQDMITVIDGLQRPETKERSLAAIRNLAASSYSYAGGAETIDACLAISAYNDGRKWLAHALNNPETGKRIDTMVQKARQYLADHDGKPSILDWDKPALHALDYQLVDEIRKATSQVCTTDDIRQTAYSLAESTANIAINEVQAAVTSVGKHNRKDPFHKRRIVR